jgi:N-acetylgalactosamine-N,N'-diacetylbacillosaminyl-diphospho-undecaprenol 4-alpha-N-acetylgalactosaminyltransferase
MKYLLVIDQIKQGGAERILVDFDAYLKQLGHKVKVFAMSGKKEDSPWTESLDVTYGCSSSDDSFGGKLLQFITIYKTFRNLVSSYNPDGIYSSLEKSNFLTSLVNVNCKKIMSVHNVLSIQYLKIKNSIVRSLWYSIIKYVYNRCDKVVAVSNQVSEDLISNFGVRKDQIQVVNNYVDGDSILSKSCEIVENFTFEKDLFYIFNIGRFSNQKAHWRLLKAFSYILTQHINKDVRLIVMGNGEYETQMHKLAEDLNLSNKVCFLPFDKNPFKYLRNADMFVLSSNFEGFPVVLAEATSLGIPFVGTRKSMPEEMFYDKEVYEQCVCKVEDVKENFTPEIAADDIALGNVMLKMINDDSFRNGFYNKVRIMVGKEDQFSSYLSLLL